MVRKKIRTETQLMPVPVDFYTFVRQKKAEDPFKFKTNYDVFDHLMGKEIQEQPKKKNKPFWGKI